MTDYVVSNRGVCESINARMNAWMGFPDGRGTDNYATVRQHARTRSKWFIVLKEVYAPNGKVRMSDMVARLTGAEVATIKTHAELVADGAFPSGI